MRGKNGSGGFLKLTIQRALGWRFVLSLFLVAVAFFLDTEVSARNVLLGLYPPQPHEGLSIYIENILMFGINYKLFLIFMTLGFAAEIPQDWNAGIVPSLVKNLGISRYARIQVGVAALSGGISVAGGFILYYLCMRTKLPLLSQNFEHEWFYEFLEGMPYYGGLTREDAALFILFLTIIFFMSGVAWTALAAGMSIYLKNRYLVIIFPYLLSRCYIEAAKILQIPNTMRLDRWFSAMVQPFPIPVCLGIMGGICLLVCIVSKRIFMITVKRRLESGWN